MSIRSVVAAALLMTGYPLGLAAAQEVPPPTGANREDLLGSGEILPDGYVPPPADPRDFEGVWLPTRGDMTRPPALAATATRPAGPASEASGTVVQCAPISRINGAAGGLSDLWVQGPGMTLMISEEGHRLD